MKYKIKHLGIAVADIEPALSFYQDAFGLFLISGPFDDPIQRVRVCFVGDKSSRETTLELISPLSNDSPIAGFLSKGIGAYHICYEVEDIELALSDLRSRGCIVVSSPVKAVAYEGRSIAWCYTPTNHLVELLKTNK